MDQTITLKEQIKSQLEKTGTISGADLQNMAAAAAAPANPGIQAMPDPMTVDDKVVVGKESLDVLTQAGDDKYGDKAIEDDMIRSDSADDIFGVVDDTGPVTVTAADKRRFTDAFVDGKRFTREFELCGGAIKGVFRSRKTGETRAILEELIRQAIVHNHSMVEHAAKIRHALLHCQLAEFKGVSRKELEAPLKAVEKIDKVNKTVEIIPPDWSEEMEIICNDMGEGLVNSLYRELKIFEKVYWILVKNSSNQDFWHPEDFIIE